MLHDAIVFFNFEIIAAVPGFGGFVAGAAGIANFIFIISVSLAMLFLAEIDNPRKL